MVRSSKWIKNTDPEMLVSQVARDSLRERLDAVWYYAPRAAAKPKSNQKKDRERHVEDVHQLRVSVRRATAAIEIYAPLLPPRKARSMRKRLRALRKAANDARDLDVLAERLKRLKKTNRTAVTRVLREVAKRRKAAQKPLARAHKEARANDFRRKSRKLADGVKWRSSANEPTFGEFARATFEPLAHSFFEAARADLSDVKALHRVRIRGKAVRYAMELLAGGFEEPFRRDLYPVFGEVQERLGLINDHATAIALYQRWIARGDAPPVQAELSGLIERERESLDRERRLFGLWWTAQRAASLAEQFDAAIQRPQTRMHPASSPQAAPRRKRRAV